MKKFYTYFIFLFLISQSVLSQSSNEDFQTIMQLEDSRSFGNNDELITLLYSINPDTRLRALDALSNIGDSSILPKLGFLLAGPYKDYPNSEDLRYLAFLLGQIPGRKSKDDLEFMIDNVDFQVKNYLNIKAEIINSMGKTGDEGTLEKVIDEAQSYPELMAPAAMSLGRFALRKIKNGKSVDALMNIVNNSKDTIALRNAAFAFWRIGDKELLEKARLEIYALAESSNEQTRMWAFNALGRLQDKLFLTFLLESFNSEKDWRVKVNMLNSVLNYDLDSLSEFTTKLIDLFKDASADENEHVSLTGLNVFGKMFADLKNSKNELARSMFEKMKEEFIYELDSAKNISWRQKNEMFNAMSLVFRDDIKEDLLRAFRNSVDYNVKAGIVRAFGNFDNGMVYRDVREEISKDVQKYNKENPNTGGAMIGSEDLAKLYRGFIDMLTNLDERVDEENLNTIRLIYTEFVSSKDPVIVNTSLEALKDSLYLKFADETNSVILFDYNELDYYKDPDAMISFIDAMGERKIAGAKEILEKNLTSQSYDLADYSSKALEKITGRKFEFSAKPRSDFDWQYIEDLTRNNIVTVKTSKGNIKIELFPDVAPFTVMNFLKLSENNYYDGSIFHRVVSNFVIQGGDPTGTGFSGPGYSIRSELSDLPFERGMVGMASSGKDTEGSQFFITHSATPHLDGKYTLFGKVIEGMDVVDKIMIGDVIEDITLNKK